MLTNRTNADTRVGSITRLAQSWAISLAAENKAARTIGGYTETVSQFVTFLTERGMPSGATAIRREHVETYLVDVLAVTGGPQTVNPNTSVNVGKFVYRM